MYQCRPLDICGPVWAKGASCLTCFLPARFASALNGSYSDLGEFLDLQLHNVAIKNAKQNNFTAKFISCVPKK